MRRKTTATIVARRNLRHRLGMFLSVFAMMFGIFFRVVDFVYPDGQRNRGAELGHFHGNDTGTGQ